MPVPLGGGGSMVGVKPEGFPSSLSGTDTQADTCRLCKGIDDGRLKSCIVEGLCMHIRVCTCVCVSAWMDVCFLCELQPNRILCEEWTAAAFERIRAGFESSVVVDRWSLEKQTVLMFFSCRLLFRSVSQRGAAPKIRTDIYAPTE